MRKWHHMACRCYKVSGAAPGIYINTVQNRRVMETEWVQGQLSPGGGLGNEVPRSWSSLVEYKLTRLWKHFKNAYLTVYELYVVTSSLPPYLHENPGYFPGFGIWGCQPTLGVPSLLLSPSLSPSLPSPSLPPFYTLPSLEVGLLA